MMVVARAWLLAPEVGEATNVELVRVTGLPVNTVRCEDVDQRTSSVVSGRPLRDRARGLIAAPPRRLGRSPGEPASSIRRAAVAPITSVMDL